MKTRTCAICGVDKLATDDHFGKDGAHSYCRPCERTRGWIERRFGEDARNDWVEFMHKPERR